MNEIFHLLQHLLQHLLDIRLVRYNTNNNLLIHS